jgi:Tfp pilus assembly protein PilF
MSRTAVAVAGLVCVLTASRLGAQDSVAVDSTAAVTVAAAAAERDSGRFDSAAVILRRVLEQQPANGEAVRMLAQTLYWLKDTAAARVLYERGIAEHPEDWTMRLDYAQMLVENRRDARALELLPPLHGVPEARARAATLLGTLRYWQGDLSGAARSFKVAIDADSASAGAIRQLAEIRAVAAPWIAVGASGKHDDQPLDGFGGEVEGGWYADPSLALSARVRPMYFTYNNTESATIVAADAGFSHYSFAARLETRLSAGAASKMGDESWTEWIARGSMKLRFKGPVYIEARGERGPYLATLSSLEQLVTSAAGAVALGVEHPRGWLGETAFRVERFEDDNTVRSVHAWLLAPVYRNEESSVSVGYAFGFQDADESRFAGQYVPYYTPGNIVSHSAVGSMRIRVSPKANMTIRGSHAVFAREDAPVVPFTPGAGQPGNLTFDRRRFTPWDAHISLDGAVTRSLTLSASVDAMKTAFYQATTAGVRATYRFLP